MMKSVVAVRLRLSVAVLLLTAPMLVGATGEPEGFRDEATPPHGCGCAFPKDATDPPVVRLGIDGGGSLPLRPRWIHGLECSGGGSGGSCFASPGSNCYLSVYYNHSSGEWEMGCTG